jgi:hypothetical protein
MQEWINILIAFAHDDQSYDFGTRDINEMNVVTSEDVIEIQKDDRWDHLLKRDHLLKLADVFASG